MARLFGDILECAILRKRNKLQLAAGMVKRQSDEARTYTKCCQCKCPLTEDQVYGEWDDYCIDCRHEETQH